MPNSTVDDQDSRVLYAGPWSHFRGLPGDKWNASDWSGGTFSSCGSGVGSGGSSGSGGSKKSGGPGCELRVSFVGTSAALLGDTNGKHGQFSCRLLDERGEPEGLWGWYDGGSRWWWPYQHNAVLCSVSSLPNTNHTLVLDVQPDQVVDGIAFDYMTSSDEVPEGTARSWKSDFNDAVPPSAFRNTTATPFLPVNTASFAPAPSSTSPSSSSGVNKLAVGLGAGLGGFFALLSLIALGIFLVHRKRRQLRSRASHRHEALGSYDADSTWYPEPASEAGQLGGLSPPSGREGREPMHQAATMSGKRASYADSPVSPHAYESSPASGTGYEAWSPENTSGPATFDSRTPFVYPALGGPPYGYDHPTSAYPPLGPPSSSAAPLLAPVPLITAPVPHSIRRASAVPSGYSSRNSRVSTVMDLPPDAPLEDPQSFAER
ncbi:hypothetical protein JCM8208_006002 [Rhodotorula glutinis]